MTAPTKTDPLAHAGEANEHSEAGDSWIRLPGLFRSWEFEHVVEHDDDYLVEEAGECDSGMPLFAIFHRTRANEGAA